MLLAIAGILLVLWLAGFALNLVGSFVHVLLVLGVALLIAHFFRGAGSRAV